MRSASYIHIPDESSNQTGDETGVHAEEAEADKGIAFNDQSSRRGFIWKVFLILMCQLLITFECVWEFSFSKASQEWVNKNPVLLWIALAVFIVTMVCMARWGENVRRKTPMNIIFLFLFTLAESLFLGTIAVLYETAEVLITVGIMAAVALGLTLFALQTKWEFTMCGVVRVTCLVVFVIYGIIGFLYPPFVITLFYASLGVILFSVYLVYDTQRMMDGEHKYSISPKEYIFAALNLYLDIVNIFMDKLALIKRSRT